MKEIWRRVEHIFLTVQQARARVTELGDTPGAWDIAELAKELEDAGRRLALLSACGRFVRIEGDLR